MRHVARSILQSHFQKQKKYKRHSPLTITFSPEDMSTQENFGARLLKESNSLTKVHYQKSIQDVIQETHKSRLIKKPTSKEKALQRRNILRDVKNTMEEELNKEADSLVLQNRLSWETYNKIRTNQGLKRKQDDDMHVHVPVAKRKKHGCTNENLHIDKQSLLEEARTWEEGQVINWSELGTKYGLVEANRGQIIKEFLAEHGIEAAQARQRSSRASRRSKKRLPGGTVSFPILAPVKQVKEKVKHRIESGEIFLGDEVVKTSYTTITIKRLIKFQIKD